MCVVEVLVFVKALGAEGVFRWYWLCGEDHSYPYRAVVDRRFLSVPYVCVVVVGFLVRGVCVGKSSPLS